MSGVVYRAYNFKASPQSSLLQALDQQSKRACLDHAGKENHEEDASLNKVGYSQFDVMPLCWRWQIGFWVPELGCLADPPKCSHSCLPLLTNCGPDAQL